MNPSGVVKVFGISRVRWFGSLIAAALCGLSVLTAAAAPAESAASVPAERDMAQWIERMHSAPCSRAYAGTFVVLSANGAMSSSRIWHACDGQQQLERVESLSGTPRTVSSQ